MGKHTAIIALDMNYDARVKKGGLELSPYQTIQYLCHRLQILCEELQKKHPDSRWLIAWPESGIHHLSNIATFTSAGKKELKKALAHLCWQYPQLMIIAGSTFSTKKTSLIKAKELLTYYKTHTWLHDNPEFNKHKESIEQLLREAKSLDPDEKTEVQIMRNTCFIFTSAKIFLMKSPPLSSTLEHYKNSYVFTKDPLALIYVNDNAEATILQIKDKAALAALLAKAKLDPDTPLQSRTENADLINQFADYIKSTGHEHINRIDKISPFDEMDTFPNHYFKVGGKKRNMQHIFGDVGVEICLEHRSGVLKNEVKDAKITPKLQCVVSSSTTIDADKVVAEHVLYVDTLGRPCLFNMKNSDSPYHFYVHDFVSDDVQNLRLTAEVYPFYSYFLEQIKAMQAQTNDEEIVEHLNRYRDAVQDYVPQELLLSSANDESYQTFREFIKGMYSDEKLSEFKKTIKEIHTELKRMYQFEKRHHLAPPSKEPEEEKLLSGGHTLFSGTTTSQSSADSAPTKNSHRKQGI